MRQHSDGSCGDRRPTVPAVPDNAAPIVLVHGWGGSFQTTWRQSGFTELLADAGREVIGVDLLGHGDAPKPHEPEPSTPT